MAAPPPPPARPQVAEQSKDKEEAEFLPLPIDSKEEWETTASILRSYDVKQPGDLDGMITLLSRQHFKCDWFKDALTRHPDFPWKDFIEKALPIVRTLALEMPKLFPQKVPLLRSSSSSPSPAAAAAVGADKKKQKKVIAAVQLSRRQTACLLIHGTLGTMYEMDLDSLRGPKRRFPSFAIPGLFLGETNQKVLCLLNYLRHVGLEQPTASTSGVPDDMVTFERVGIVEAPSWAAMGDVPLCKVKLFTGRESISDSSAPFHLDFANKYIGGGVLRTGSVQEEIMFLEKPECLVALALCEVMKPNEAILITGAERHSILTGYGKEQYHTGIRFAGDATRAKKPTIIAIDAMLAFEKPQFTTKWIDREILKAYAGFCAATGSTIATGNWGCGAFKGDHQLKFIQQWIAASAAQVDTMEYYSFGDIRLGEQPMTTAELLSSKYPTVSALYQALFVSPLAENQTFQTLLTSK